MLKRYLDSRVYTFIPYLVDVFINGSRFTNTKHQFPFLTTQSLPPLYEYLELSEKKARLRIVLIYF